MSELVRMSFSIEKPLSDRLEKLVKQRGYTNRSEFVRDMIREQLVADEWKADAEVLGTITLIYDHHKRMISEKLIDLQHDHHEAILATTHVHLSSHLCAEVVLVQDTASHVKKIADLMQQQKGVLHCELSMASTGRHLH